MIHFVTGQTQKYHTDRSYLTQWFYKDILVITDVDINQESELESMINDHPCKTVIVDLSHNAMPESDIPEFLKKYTILSTMYTEWYNYGQNQIHYFPLWLWMFNRRSNQFFGPVSFDAGGAKTKEMMCLNRNLPSHRVKFIKAINPILENIVYSYDTKGLPGDVIDSANNRPKIDIGVGHVVYSQCAVNIVTETVMDRPSVSEKSCKPFVARQIPIILGPMNVNQFLADLGLDMFQDLVPWHEWDQEPNEDKRIQRVAKFAIAWQQSGTILSDYKKVTDRIERNKQYFHSQEFQIKLLRCMPVHDPFKP